MSAHFFADAAALAAITISKGFRSIPFHIEFYVHAGISVKIGWGIFSFTIDFSFEKTLEYSGRIGTNTIIPKSFPKLNPGTPLPPSAQELIRNWIGLDPHTQPTLTVYIIADLTAGMNEQGLIVPRSFFHFIFLLNVILVSFSSQGCCIVARTHNCV